MWGAYAYPEVRSDLQNQNRQKGFSYRLYGLVSFQAAAMRIREVPFYRYTWSIEFQTELEFSRRIRKPMGVPSFVALTNLQRHRLRAYLVTVLKPSFCSTSPFMAEPGRHRILSNIIVLSKPMSASLQPHGGGTSFRDYWLSLVH
jgi:hypothetical protein